MKTARRAGVVRALVEQRVREACRILLPDEAATDPVRALTSLVDGVCAAEDGTPRLWLLISSIAGAFPTARELVGVRRRVELAQPGDRLSAFLAEIRPIAAHRGDWDRPVRIVESGLVIDVDFCAKYVHNTGIQRVVRNLVPRIVDVLDTEPELVAWTRDTEVRSASASAGARQAGAMRTLTAVERERVLSWATRDHAARSTDTGEGELIVPWRSTVFLPEVAAPTVIERLAGLAEHSGNRVVMIGYDLIPIVSAQWVSGDEAERSAHYLTIVKNASEVLAISEAMVGEFGGLASSFAVQGRAAPRITAVPLPSGSVTAPPAPDPGDGIPVVVCLGSHEPRKNQESVLFAAETLQREGVDFRMVFVGGGDQERTVPFDRRVRRLRREGLRIESHRRLPDDQLWALLAAARFNVLLSLHEGFGLPIVESLSHGTPVLTSDYGSMAEIARDGGCVTADPRDDQAIVSAMRRMLTDDALDRELRAQIPRIPARTWDDYARAIAHQLMPATGGRRA